MEKLMLALKVFFVILNIAIIVIVLKQDAKERGFGSRSAAVKASYLSKEKRMTAERAQVIATRVMIAMYAAAALILLVAG